MMAIAATRPVVLPNSEARAIEQQLFDVAKSVKAGPLASKRGALPEFTKYEYTPAQKSCLQSMTKVDRESRKGRCYQCGQRNKMLGHPGCPKGDSTKPLVCNTPPVTVVALHWSLARSSVVILLLVVRHAFARTMVRRYPLLMRVLMWAT